ncbi:MAG: HDIG domain-containing metalloprotein [Planctomycetota bacterium]
MSDRSNDPRKPDQKKGDPKKAPKPKASKPSKGTGSAARREGVRHIVEQTKHSRLQRVMASPDALRVLGIGLAFVIVTATVCFAFRGSLLPAPDRTATDTRTSRVDFSIEAPEDTERARELERQNTPPVYALEPTTIDFIVGSLATLPEALAATETFSEVDAQLVERFGLTQEAYNAIKPEGADGERSARWATQIGRVGGVLSRTALLSNQAFQRINGSSYNDLVLVRPSASGEAGEPVRTTIRKFTALPIEGDLTEFDLRLRTELREVANRAGLYDEKARVLVERVIREGRPTYRLDRDATERAVAEAVAGVSPVVRSYNEGEVLYTAGQRVNASTYAVAREEIASYRDARPFLASLTRWLGLAGVVAIVAAAIAGYLWFFYRSLLTHPWRLAALAGMLSGATLLSAWLATRAPDLVWAAVLTPTLYVGMIAVVAYDRRLAMLVGVASMLLTATALDLGEGHFVAGLVGVMLAAWRLADIRSRNDVVRGGVVTTAGVALGVIVVGLVERPLTGVVTIDLVERTRAGLVLLELLVDAAIAGAGAFLAAALLLVALQLIERVFGITTGMTLAELRDPQHPLLRQLQQRAPGTYNHALNVATIAESAADAIGADALHAYVGAVYHDIGKMNKPDYFVENQSPGLNKHDRLSPAMSLLVIVGHVKDGVELAREYGLPKSLHHYIESHHGTTLVEYFYFQAQKQADEDDNTDRPTEFEYRYPGPRPQTREAAILMLADASESAARSLDTPTASRIEALVHDLARKRLLDGQFDECQLTLRELTLIEGAITRTLSSIHHGRIAYPKGEPEHAKEDERNEEGVVATG